MTNRLLLEAGVGTYRAAWGPFESPGNPTRGLARVTELHGAERRGRRTSSTARRTGRRTSTTRTRGASSASYVTGAHNLKFGYDGSYLVEDIQNHGNDLNLAYTFNGGRPSQLTESLRVYHPERPRQNDGALRAGPVDARADDAAGRAALRQRVELFAGADDRSGADQRPDVPGDAADLRANRRRQLQGHLAARRPGARRLRQRQDGRQGQLRQVPGPGEQPEQQLLDLQSDRRASRRRRRGRGPTTAPAGRERPDTATSSRSAT